MVLGMNKNDFKLIGIIIIIVCVLFIFHFFNKEKANNALVYHGSDLVLTINLNVDNNYVVQGDNGEVVIEVKDKKIKVVSENSPYHLCSKQGYISNTNESIICLPNRIIIELPKDNNIDTEVR